MTDSVGMDMLVEGSVPSRAGLSSSSALVCCSALVTMHANSKPLSKVDRFVSCFGAFPPKEWPQGEQRSLIKSSFHLKKKKFLMFPESPHAKYFAWFQLELSEICQHCEHYIGTEGGGMDQAICFLAQSGTVSGIQFLWDWNTLKTHFWWFAVCLLFCIYRPSWSSLIQFEPLTSNSQMVPLSLSATAVWRWTKLPLDTSTHESQSVGWLLRYSCICLANTTTALQIPLVYMAVEFPVSKCCSVLTLKLFIFRISEAVIPRKY